MYGQIPIFAGLIFLGLGHSRLKLRVEKLPFGCIWFAGHLLCIAAVLAFSLAESHGSRWKLFDTEDCVKSFLYILGTVLLALACVPFRVWSETLRATSPLWLYSVLAGLAGWLSGIPIKLLWLATSTAQYGFFQRAALHSVQAGLSLFYPNVIMDESTFLIGTPNYQVIIAGGCSGIEGLGMVLIFTGTWLWYLRKECRFPQALLLVPIALGCSWLLNIVRLCALILIATVGNQEVADVGFHIRAGWIAFTAVALAFSIATQKLSWVRRPSANLYATSPLVKEPLISAVENPHERHGESPAIRAFLIPFLAILAAAFISKAASGYFEWPYPLRFFAAAVALWYFRGELKKLDWRFGWAGPLTGVVIFLVWIAPTAFVRFWSAQAPAASPLGPALSELSPFARWGWIGIRVAAACITVPIAEELAFRGYLARRFVSREFDEVPFTSLTMLPILFSSIAFGLMHGKQWLVGIFAGLAYAAVLRWRGRVGDAVVAHAISNLLLAAWVLCLGDWSQW